MGTNGHDYLGRVHTHQEKFRPLPFDVERARRRRPGLTFLVVLVILGGFVVLLAVFT